MCEVPDVSVAQPYILKTFGELKQQKGSSFCHIQSGFQKQNKTKPQKTYVLLQLKTIWGCKFGRPAYHIRETGLTSRLHSRLQHPVDADPRRQQVLAHVTLGPCHPHMRPWWTFQLLASAWSRLTSCGNVGNKPVDARCAFKKNLQSMESLRARRTLVPLCPD